MKRFLSAILITGLMSVLCGVALAQSTGPSEDKQAGKAKVADKAKAADAKTKQSWDWGNKSARPKEVQKTDREKSGKDIKADREHSDGGGDTRAMNKTEKPVPKTATKATSKTTDPKAKTAQ